MSPMLYTRQPRHPSSQSQTWQISFCPFSWPITRDPLNSMTSPDYTKISRHGLRSGQRHRRPGSRSLDSRRPHRRSADRSRGPPITHDRRPRPGRDARRHRHALPYRRAEGERRPQDAARGKAAAANRCLARTSRTAARWAASPARSPPATSTPAWATPRPSTPPIPPLGARHAHEEFEDTPCIDKGFYVLMGNNHYVMQSPADERAAEAQGVHRLAAGIHQRLRSEARESRRRRSLEDRIRPATSAVSIRRSIIST